MKAIHYNITGIKCDAEGCDYRDASIGYKQYAKYLNKPCPKCGANLLTEADFELCQQMIKVIEIANYFIGEVPDTDKRGQGFV